MAFNVEKCKVMHVGNWEDSRTYYTEDRELSVASCEKDLGVWISADVPSSVCMPVIRLPKYWV